MKIIGLTGGIASGKSTVSTWFKDQGLPVLDADFVYKELTKPGQVLYNRLVDAFTSQILLEDDTINWPRLSQKVFSDEGIRNKLNSITHPIVKEELLSRLSVLKEENVEMVIVSVPLLFEAGFDQFCDATICVDVPRSVQIERLMLRDRLTKEQAILRIDSQMPLSKKKKLATFVLDNGKDREKTKAQFAKLLATIKE
ncbi:MAG: dephospho-CoA kinase [Candidatus Izemoplasmatales bacterium]|nr:dephospho-CoA kinase [Candidatus Izemoplasmatales bacterium]